MNRFMSGIIGAAAIATGAGSASAAMLYWDFNVFSRSTIGSANQGYGSDFQGASGAVGDAYFNGFAARTLSSSSPSLSKGFYGGGSFSLSGSVNFGGIDVAQGVTMNGASIAGNVNAGGNLGGSSGSVNGNATLGGTKTAGNALTVSGSVAQNQTYTAAIDLVAASAYFQNAGNYAAGLAPNTSYSNNYGELIINTTGPLSIVNLNANDFVTAWGIRVVGAGTVIMNVGGTALNFSSKTWTYMNGASSAGTLLNLNEAMSVTMSGGHNVNILAAKASTTFSSGVLTGNLIVGSLMGSGQVNWSPDGGFNGAVFIPSSGSGVMILAGAGLIAFRRRNS